MFTPTGTVPVGIPTEVAKTITDLFGPDAPANQWLSFGAWVNANSTRQTFKSKLVYKDTQFRFNTDFTNTKPEEVVNGKLVLLDPQETKNAKILEFFKTIKKHGTSFPFTMTTKLTKAGKEVNLAKFK